MLLPVNREPALRELRRFGVVMLAGFGVLGALSWWAGSPGGGAAAPRFAWVGSGRQTTAMVLWVAGALLAAGAWGPHGVARRIYSGWMTVGAALGSVMTMVLLTLMFFIVLPVFALARFRDPLRLRRRPAGESYWEPFKAVEHTIERTLRPF